MDKNAFLEALGSWYSPRLRRTIFENTSWHPGGWLTDHGPSYKPRNSLVSWGISYRPVWLDLVSSIMPRGLGGVMPTDALGNRHTYLSSGPWSDLWTSSSLFWPLSRSHSVSPPNLVRLYVLKGPTTGLQPLPIIVTEESCLNRDSAGNTLICTLGDPERASYLVTQNHGLPAVSCV